VIVIRRESKGLFLYERGRLVRRLGVATGTWEYPTPLGTFAVVDKQYNPWWYPPSSEWARGLEPVPPGPGNPLGTRWMGLSVYGVGIHGTPDAASIGYSASHGCIRMHIWDAEWLFERVELGTPVVIVSA
jgi:lipoprotein-anchoring transpeptidase ErfK/SrfK